MEFRAIRNQQDKEYEETLRADKAKVHNNKNNVICILIVLICLNACFIIQVEERKQIMVRLVNSVYALYL